MLKRKLTRNSLSLTQRSDTGIVRTRFVASSHFGIEKVDTTISQSLDEPTELSALAHMESLNSLANAIQTRQSKSYEDLDTSLNAMKEVLVELYASIGYTTGISELLDNEKEGV